MSEVEFREHMSSHLKAADGEGPGKETFLSDLRYMQGQYDSREDLIKLHEYLSNEEMERKDHRIVRLLYLSLPPSAFPACAETLGQVCKSPYGHTRIIVEKPFGRDLASFRELSAILRKSFSPEEIYRIDHYVGKEIVQNLLVLRFCNLFLDPLWNRSHISSIEITFEENIGVEGRGAYYDQYGVIRDIMQNHLMQVVALLCMEPPVSLNPSEIRNEKVKVLKAIRPVKSDSIVIGQYRGRGTEVGYQQDPTVHPRSITPTFAAAILNIHNRRWDGVPIMLKCGKGMEERRAEIRVQFRSVPGELYKDVASLRPNELVIRIHPDEAIYWNIMNKVPGISTVVAPGRLDLQYRSTYDLPIPDAYVRLLLDCLRGDQSSFVFEEELEASWKIYDPILRELESKKIKPLSYVFGSRGPAAADYLVAAKGLQWHTGEE
eukprot:TRINITY_DN601_c0_g1_i4.p1 TRINITY_DN601_c0_g1~~TRINITY_DN601_c0_g1_i4.p1  ORF type:complete len:434 (-),score=114.68 TRINITY_DN601_c0_g1_i4:157-1458(-)